MVAYKRKHQRGTPKKAEEKESRRIITAKISKREIIPKRRVKRPAKAKLQAFEEAVQTLSDEEEPTLPIS